MYLPILYINLVLISLLVLVALFKGSSSCLLFSRHNIFHDSYLDTYNMAYTETGFREALESGMEQGARHYASAFTLHVRFENDDTGADKDAEHFRAICHAYNLLLPHEIVIPPTDPAPAWTIQTQIWRIPPQSPLEPEELGTGALRGACNPQPQWSPRVPNQRPRTPIFPV